MGYGESANRHKTVFVGNISYEATEEEIRSLFQQVGLIANLRLVSDRDTGKRKGFGFIEFVDRESALSAVRNLNECDLYGRPLRVNLAEHGGNSQQQAQQAGEGAAGAHQDARPATFRPYRPQAA